MLRSRLMGSLRRQDWTAVAIELLTVMLGLFLGLQLNDWNDERQARAREKAALERLHEESESVVSYFHNFIERFDKLNAKQEAAIAALSTGDQAKFDAHELADHIGSLTFYPGIAPPRATYDELSGSGLLNAVGSPKVRTAVARYYSKLSFIQSQLDYFRQSNTGNEALLNTGQSTSYVPNAPEGERFVYTADFAVIAADRAYMTTLVNFLRNQLVFQKYRKETKAAAEEMCQALAEALHEKCAAVERPSAPAGQNR
jgi:hypothetical protein